ncbi:MAG: PASTA domain-containing protein [Acidimicrobiales bacterium]|nr:PASTA domain-containing protein [Acidimicrobiales bacterium]
MTVDNYVGRVLGDRYQLISPIGAGASATVYTADDRSLERRVAVKVLHQSLANDPKFAKRFRNEARAVAQLAHPRILNVYDWAEGRDCYIVTELLVGGSLRDMLDRGHLLSPSQALVVGLHALEGLEAAHAAGFVHRDIKPANLLFGPDSRLRIADFGIARAVAEAAWTEPEGALIGTARYAAPEQGSGVSVTGAADVYSLALTLIEAVTGDVPLIADSPIATMVLRQDTNVEVPAGLGPLWEGLSAATKANPEQRPSASRLIRSFHRAAADLPRPYVLPLANLADDAPSALDYPEVTGTGGTDVLGDNGSRPPSYVDDDGEEVVDLTPFALHFADDDLAAMGLSSGEVDAVPSDTRGDMADLDSATRTLWPYVMAGFIVLAGITILVSSAVFRSDVAAVPVPAAIDGPELEAFVGMSEPDAVALLKEEGWVPAVVTDRVSGTLPGEVLAQNPVPGNRWAAGQIVTLLVSEGPPLVTVPPVVGIDRREALELVRAVGLVAGQAEEVFDEDIPADLVITSSLPVGEAVPEGETITLTISSGPKPRPTPNLTGVSIDDATAQLAQLGVTLSIAGDDYSLVVPEGSIISTLPIPNALVPKGGDVAAIVSAGKPFVTVPNTRGQTVSQATSRLEALGLVVIGVEGAPNRPVLVTDPPNPDSVRVGTEVTIITRR